MNKDVKEEFDALWNQVFNPDTSIKNCGRVKTKALIAFCNQHFTTGSVSSYGDEKTGYMYVDEMLDLKKRLS